MNQTVPDPSLSTSIGLTPESQDVLDDQTAMEEMKKAFAQIEALKQDESPQEEVEEKPDETASDEPDGAVLEEQTTPPVEGQPEQEKPVADEPPKKKKASVWDTYKREKYALLEEKESLARENQKLKDMLEESVYRGTYHYGKSAYAELDKAMDAKKKAFEEGDTDALIKADVSLIKAQRAVDDLEAWMEEEKRKTPEPTPKAPASDSAPSSKLSAAQNAMAQDWLQEHPDLNPSLPSYQSEKAQKVAGFINHLDSYIAQNNLQHTFYSDAYFQTVNDFIVDLERPSQGATVPTPAASTTASPPVAGVRNSHGTTSPTKQKVEVVLTADERRMARNAGIPEKEWLKYKIEELRSRT